MIALTAHVNACSMKDAAQLLSGETDPSDTVPRERSKKAARSLQPLSYLETEHPKLGVFGITKETLEHFGAGYAPKGIMRGKLAVPIHDEEGHLVAYFGIAPEDDQRELAFPKDFAPAQFLFNIHNLDDEVIQLCRHPVDVLMAWQNGVENTIAALTPTISASQFLLMAETSNRLGNVPFEIP